MTEQQKKNLAKGTKINEELSRKYQLKGAESKVRRRKERLIIREELEKRLGVSDLAEILDNLIARAKEDSRDFEVLQAAIGQKPSDKQEVNLSGGVSLENYLRQFDDE